MRKIAFIKQGAFSHINARVLEQLKRRYPGHEVIVIDVQSDVVGRHPLWRAAALWGRVRLRGFTTLLHRRNLRDFFYQTPLVFHRLKRAIQSRLRPHASDLAFTFQTQSLFDARCARVPHFVYTDHTHLANLGYPGFDRKLLLPASWTSLEREIYEHATLNLTMSKHVSCSIVDDYGLPREQVQCVGAGSNIGAEPLPLDNENYRNRNVLFVGIDWERKGGPQLLQAFERVVKVHPQARLTIVGAAPAVSLPNCRVLGRLPLHQVKPEYARASIFCLPTRMEPFGIAPLEAFVQKIPVVASRLGALPDFVHDGVNGRLVPPDDIDALTRALNELLADPERCRQWGENGHAFVAENYTWPAVGERLAAAVRTKIGV